jgi:hypothetical protein
MSFNAFVAYYPFDTYNAVPKLGHADKFAAFADKYHAAALNIDVAAATMKLNDYIGFFAVPEYFFLKSYRQVRSKDPEVELYSEMEYNALLAMLVSLSDQHHRIVILPGTISWCRKRDSVLNTTRQDQPVQIRYDGFSSTPVCFCGNLIHTYNKVMNDGMIDKGAAETQFVPGTASPLFQVRRLLCGLEICGDFEQKNLAKATGPQSLDFEFMMSATNPHDFSKGATVGKGAIDGIPVKNGGYFVHVDQKPEKAALYNGVWCVSRGTGWHSIDKSGIPKEGREDPDLYDPWTLREVKQDKGGSERSVGTVVALECLSNYRRADAVPWVLLPDEVPTYQNYPETSLSALFVSHEGLKLAGKAAATRALDPVTGMYEVTLTVNLVREGGTRSAINNRTVVFVGSGATVRPTSAQTDRAGSASAVFTCRKDQPARLIAGFHSAEVVFNSKIAWLGPGEVTKIAQLKGTPHPLVPTFYAPIP